MNKEELNLKLLKGSDIKVHGLNISPFRIGYIIDTLGFLKYQNITSVLLVSKYKLEDADLIPEETFNQIQDYDLFVYTPELMSKLVDSLRLFLQNDNIHYVKKNKKIVVINNIANKDEFEDIWIDRDNYEEIADVLRAMYGLSFKKELEYNPANEEARKLIKEIKAGKLHKQPKKEDPTWGSIISGVAWRSTSGINILNVFDLTVYQLYDALSRMEANDTYNFTISGLYAGTINKSDIDFSKISWMRNYN